MKRQEAIAVLFELVEGSVGLDGHGLELTAPISPNSGYQITIRGVLDEETKKHIQTIIVSHQLACQTGSIWRTKHSLNKTEPDTLIIYQP